MATPTVKMYPLAKIIVDPSLQIRIKNSDAYVKELQEAIQNGAELPAVDLVVDPTKREDGDTEERYLVAEGVHRVLAYTELKWEKIPAIVHESTPKTAKTRALELSLTRNCHHGLRMSNADKAKAVSMALADLNIRRKSDKAIAAMCGVSAPLVAKIRTGEPMPSEKTTKHVEFEATVSQDDPQMQEPVVADEGEDKVSTFKKWFKEGFLDWQTCIDIMNELEAKKSVFARLAKNGGIIATTTPDNKSSEIRFCNAKFSGGKLWLELV